MEAKMEEQRQIIEQLKQTLNALTISQNTTSNKTPADEPFYHINEHTYEDCAQEFIDFTYENPTTYHVIEFFSKLLEGKGFKYLPEKKTWNDELEPGKPGRYYTIRNGTNMTAWVIGKKWKPESGVGVVASHVDSLTAKLKPASLMEKVEGYKLFGVAPYGGTLNELWFDRDLGIAGRVLYKKKNSSKVESTLVNSAPHPIGRIPSLAPHFGQPSEGPFNKETQAVPFFGWCCDIDDEGTITDEEKKCPLVGKHSILLLRYIAELAGIKVSEILQLDLDLFDVQKGTFGGIKKDFIFSPRMDDRLCSFTAMIAMAYYGATVDLDELSSFNMVALFDNEEVGSLTRQGAESTLLKTSICRTAKRFTNMEGLEPPTLFANSIVLSADVNHLFNPNFKEVYLKKHSPKPNWGMTISLDPNAHMATDVVGLAFVEELARKNKDTVQYFQIRNDSRSGGTVGPIVAAQLGARTIDVGISQLSMHSIRAATGTKDIAMAIKFFRGFFDNWREVYDNFGEL